MSEEETRDERADVTASMVRVPQGDGEEKNLCMLLPTSNSANFIINLGSFAKYVYDAKGQSHLFLLLPFSFHLPPMNPSSSPPLLLECYLHFLSQSRSQASSSSFSSLLFIMFFPSRPNMEEGREEEEPFGLR